MKPVCTNPHLEVVRAAYRSSSAYQRTQGVVTPAVRSLIGREPGSDDEESNAVGQDGGSQPVDARIERGSVPSRDAKARQSPAAPDPSAPALGIPIDDLEREFKEGS